MATKQRCRGEYKVEGVGGSQPLSQKKLINVVWDEETESEKQQRNTVTSDL